MSELCPVHNLEFRLVPAGVSKKTGNPYNAFYACPERGCREKPQDAPRAPQAQGQVSTATSARKASQNANLSVTKEDLHSFGKWILEEMDKRLNELQIEMTKKLAQVVESGRFTDEEIEKLDKKIS